MPERKNKNLALYSICKPVHFTNDGLSVVYDFENFKYILVDWKNPATPATKFKVLERSADKRELVAAAEMLIRARKTAKLLDGLFPPVPQPRKRKAVKR